jgi:diguanylate cyclase (GGDEF)-like protein
MYLVAIFCYSLSLIAQLGAATVSVSLIKKAKKFQSGWLFLAVALSLMLGRRISPIMFAIDTSNFNILDALLSVPISGFLFLGVLGLKRLLENTNELNDKLSFITKTDFLTSALSRQETFKRISLEIARSARTKRPIALLSLDLDHFKLVNDEFGHHIGDEVLKGMVSFLKERIREIDFIGRIGGEEFLIVLPETSESKAIEVAERLREELSHFTCYQHCGKDIKITISIGVVAISPEEITNDYAMILESYLDKADIAMYEAKKNGRNQCRVYTKTQGV